MRLGAPTASHVDLIGASLFSFPGVKNILSNWGVDAGPDAYMVEISFPAHCGLGERGPDTTNGHTETHGRAKTMTSRQHEI